MIPPLLRRSLTIILLLSCLLLIAFYYRPLGLFRHPPPPPRPASHQVAKALVLPKTWRENVEWTYELTPEWTPFIYSINHELSFDLHVPSNKGREAMTYLTFIIDHYDSLPATTAFVHATHNQRHNDVVGPETGEVLRNLRKDVLASSGYVNLRCTLNPGCPTSVHPLNPTELDVAKDDIRVHLAEIYQILFNVDRDQVPVHIGAVCCAQFVVSRDRIRERPLEDYERMRDWIIKTRLTSHDIGWVFEKVWHIVFKEPAILCPSYEECRCNLYGWCGPLPEAASSSLEPS